MRGKRKLRSMRFETILLPALLAFATFVFHARPRFYNKYFGVDAWRHLLVVDYIRKNKRIPLTSGENQLFKGPFDYPPALLVVLSFFPRRFLEKYQGFVSPFIEIIHSLLLFAVCYYLTSNLLVSLLSQTIYALIPVMAMESSQLSPRGFGSLVFSSSILLMFFYSISPSWLLLGGAVLFTIILFFSHKMASQAMFFTTALLSLVERNFIYIGIFLLSGTLALLFSRDLYIRIVKGQIAVLKFFRKNVQFRYVHQIRGIRSNREREDLDFIGRAKATIGRFPLVALVASNPFVLIFLIAAITLANETVRSQFLTISLRAEIIPKFLWWIIIMYFLGIITAQLKPFQFLGEGTKYVVYSSFPLSVVLAIFTGFYAIQKTNYWFFVPLAITAFVCFVQVLWMQRNVVIKDSMRSLTTPLKKVIKYLRSADDEVRLAVFPLAASSIVSYFADCKVLSTDSAYVHGYDQDYADFDPFLKRPLHDYVGKYRINYILINENYVKLPELKIGSTTDIVLKEDDWCLVHVKG